jgi:hypothetical protein
MMTCLIHGAAAGPNEEESAAAGGVEWTRELAQMIEA